MKVKQFYNKNQFVIYGGDAIVTLQSYNSIVAKINKKGTLIFGNDWNYSKTTLKHLYLFIEDEKMFLSDFIKNELKGLQNTKNKKAFLQKLVDNDKIIVEELD